MPKAVKKKSEHKCTLKCRHRAWCLTIWDMSAVPVWEGCDYSIAGKEVCPETKKEHYQCYVYYPNAKTFSKLKKLFPKAHIEAAQGNAEFNRAYCSKDGAFHETGTLPNQGRRNDLEAMYDLIKEDKSDKEILEEMPATYMKHFRAVDRVRQVLAEPEEFLRPMEVYVYWGDAGTGKSYAAWDYDNKLYSFKVTDKLWFDGYYKQKTVLLDDFYGKGMTYSTFLKLTEGYKQQLDVKNGHGWKNWNRMYITSNKHPKEWFDEGLTPAMKRRFTEIKHFSKIDFYTEVPGNTKGTSSVQNSEESEDELF